MQSATLESSELISSLKFVSRCIERRMTIPVLGLVRMSFKSGELHLSATNLDIELQDKISYSGDMDDKIFMVDPRNVANIFGTIPKDSAVTIEETDIEGRGLMISGGGVKLSVSTSIDAIDYPQMHFGDKRVGGEMSTCDIGEDVLEEALRLASNFVSTEETRYYLNGICLDSRKDRKLRFVATDGHRLIDYKTDVKAPKCRGHSNYILPLATIKIIRSKLKKGGNREVRLNFSGLNVVIALGDSVIKSKLIDGTYPDWTRVIPKQVSKMKFTIPAGVAIRSGIMSSQFCRALVICPTEGTATISALDGDALESKIPVGTGPNPLHQPLEGAKAETVGYDAKYLSKLASIFGDLTMRGHGSGDPVMLNPKRGVRVVLMPRRI